MWLAPTTTTTTVTSLLLRRFNKSISNKFCRAALIHQTSFFTTTTTTTTFNSSSSSTKFGGGGTFILHQQQQQANNLHTTTTTFNSSSSSSSSSSSKFGGGGGTFILHQQQQQQQQQQANNLHTTTTTSSSKFGTIILQTNEPSVDYYYGEEIKKDDIKMFMLSSGSGSDGEEEEEEEEDKDDDDDQKNKNKKKMKKKKKKKMVFKLDEDLGFSALYKDFNLQDSIRMVGSCNGIICLHDPKLRFPQRDVYLWNPATRHFRILPGAKHMQELGNTLTDFVGFGFDAETQDYKVLRISPFVVPRSYGGDRDRDRDRGRGGRCMLCRVQVYSLSSDSWRVLDGIDSLPLSPSHDQFTNRQGTYLKGCCLFLGSKPINDYGKCDLMLLSFDFTQEIFTIIELPDKNGTMHKLSLKYGNGEEFDVFKVDYLQYRSGQKINEVSYASPRCFDIRDDLSYLGDKLVAFKTPHIDFAGGYVFTTPQIDGYWYYKMWVLSEHHCSGRVVGYKPRWWTQLHEFRIKTKSKHPYAEPRCVSNDGEFALISTTSTDNNGRRKKLMLFDLVTEKAIKDFTIGDRDCRAVYVYKESQVSIMGGSGNALLRWQLPTHGTTYKLNLYAPYIDPDFPLGIGLCLTSDTGGCIGVRSLNTHVLDAEVGEALAMFEAIKWAKELELSPIIIESDSKNIVSFFMEDDDDDDEDAHSILKQAKLLLKSSENSSISFQYCSRSCNYVAEIASKLGSDRGTSWSCKDWTANFPGEVVMSLSKDLGLETAKFSENKV